VLEGLKGGRGFKLQRNEELQEDEELNIKAAESLDIPPN
jgi:hypothetical protein